MLDFFRNTRKKLAAENRFMQYSRYAVGEVLLLVVGVLIALQINIWNQNRKSNNVRISILENLNKEFEFNRGELIYSIESSNIIAGSILQLLSMMGPDYQRYDAVLLDSLLAASLMTPDFLPVNGALTDILNSGKMQYILNLELRGRLVSWHSYLDAAYKSVDQDEHAIANIVMPYLFDKVSLRNIDRVNDEYLSMLAPSPFQVDNRKVLSDLAFENMIDDHFFRIQGSLSIYKYTLQELEETHKLILQILEEEK